MTGIEIVTSAERLQAMLAHDPFTVTREPFPEPVVTSRNSPFFQYPDSVLELAEFAREHSWDVITQYSQGHMPHATTGRPGALKDLIALRFGAHPMTGRQAYAVYSRNASGGSWAWSSVMIWGPDLPPFGDCDISKLQEYLREVAPEFTTGQAAAWVGVVRAYRVEQDALGKERDAFRKVLRAAYNDAASLSGLPGLLAAAAIWGDLRKRGGHLYDADQMVSFVSRRTAEKEHA